MTIWEWLMKACNLISLRICSAIFYSFITDFLILLMEKIIPVFLCRANFTEPNFPLPRSLRYYKSVIFSCEKLESLLAFNDERVETVSFSYFSLGLCVTPARYSEFFFLWLPHTFILFLAFHKIELIFNKERFRVAGDLTGLVFLLPLFVPMWLVIIY